jgi:parallel beta-helix repeat protein
VPFTVTGWTNSATTPITAAALQADQTRIAQYVDGKTFLSVKEPPYNAVGDGVADDRLAIQAAFDAANSVGGAIVYIPPGTYLISDYLLVYNDTTVTGAGMSRSTLRAKAGSTFTGGFIQTVNTEGVEFRDFEIDLNKANTTDPGTDSAGMGIYFAATAGQGILRGAMRRIHIHDGWRLGTYLLSTTAALPLEVSIEDCVIENMVHRGIFIQRPTEVHIRNNRLVGNCLSDLGGGQIQSTDGGSAANLTIEGNTCLNSGDSSHGIAVSFVENVRVIGNLCNSNGLGGTGFGWGIVISEDVANFVVMGNRCRGNKTGGISVDVATAGVETIKESRGTVVGNVCSHAVVSHGIYCQYAKDVVIANNVCHTNTQDGIFLVAAQNCIVQGNVCRDNAVGIRNGDSATATAGGPNLIYGNLSHSNTTADYQDAATSRIPTVASAATLTLPRGAGDFVQVTGTTTITAITPTFVGHRVTLQFTGALTVTDGLVLRLAGNFVTTADDTLTIMCDGTNWFELGRAAN